MDGSASCSWPVKPKVLEKPLGRCAMWIALADKDLHISLFTGRLACCAPKRAGQSGQDKREDEESVRNHGSATMQNVN
jgi:hypothetical protein